MHWPLAGTNLVAIIFKKEPFRRSELSPLPSAAGPFILSCRLSGQVAAIDPNRHLQRSQHLNFPVAP